MTLGRSDRETGNSRPQTVQTPTAGTVPSHLATRRLRFGFIPQFSTTTVLIDTLMLTKALTGLGSIEQTTLRFKAPFLQAPRST